MADGRIAPDEVVYRRIPPKHSHFQPPDRMTSANFKLGSGDSGLSVYRAKSVDVAAVLSKPQASPGSMVAQATVGEIRAAENSKGEALNLEVVPVNDENYPGHAEIQGVITSAAARALKKIFKLVESPAR